MQLPPNPFMFAVAATIGLGAIWAAWSNHDNAFALKKVAWVEKRWGRRSSRTFLAVLGVLLLVLAVSFLTFP
ncbi:hypothetical protein LOC68_26905 [Blastopirellula sp. JC732]|uniref:Uncharacterized protein n=1 Tax=Blastopirellula sediminis TaxID=2894196 RepID=A0A9X1SMT9_9BACT|nr:hypothetical protein [Blastopirellula sediminis]MCC9604663.1 hypothetical protein [Blastopirellula sediminis]MCC9632039.1 hypothetical protein [Blastopirellula sediminis]